MRRHLLSTCGLIAAALLSSCHTEPEEMRTDLVVRNTGEQEVSFDYKVSGITHTFTIAEGEEKVLCSQEFFNLTYLLGDSICFRYGENGRCIHAKRETGYIPATDNILDPNSWTETLREGEAYTSYTYTLNI